MIKTIALAALVAGFAVHPAAATINAATPPS